MPEFGVRETKEMVKKYCKKVLLLGSEITPHEKQKSGTACVKQTYFNKYTQIRQLTQPACAR